ncbi:MULTISPECIES: SDR family oxidoreductase [unclassified Microbispora]|uniref:SDR family oxidoreductase n=1 Tax=unclassified Microbispora TaxID=2614687 RepID=UPI0014738D27|nr:MULTISPECIES: SDR family oxidoreductase [unclassified Microbispora]
MKIVVVGGSGLIGSKVVDRLGGQGHEAVVATPRTGVNTVTGEGLAEVLKGASVVVDVSNSPSFEDTAVMEFFTASTRNLLAAETEAGVGHHVALSIVGTSRLPENGYFRAKHAQEELIVASAIPHTIVYATQFFEFVGGIADTATEGDTVRVAPVLFQPIAAADVSEAVARVAVRPPAGGVEIAGPDRLRFDEVVRRVLEARRDPRRVVGDPDARYFGSKLQEGSLVPEGDADLGPTRFADWLKEHTAE